MFSFKSKLEKTRAINTMRLLQELPPLKLCVHCQHMGSMNRCNRDMKFDYNGVTGARALVGDQHYCDNERELKNKLPGAVKDGSKCGAIGQHYLEIEYESRRWYNALPGF